MCALVYFYLIFTTLFPLVYNSKYSSFPVLGNYLHEPRHLYLRWGPVIPGLHHLWCSSQKIFFAYIIHDVVHKRYSLPTSSLMYLTKGYIISGVTGSLYLSWATSFMMQPHIVYIICGVVYIIINWDWWLNSLQ